MKNFWRRKWVRRTRFRNVEVRVKVVSAPSTLTLFATRPLGHYATCKGSSYTKNVYNFFGHRTPKMYITFLSEIRCWIFLYSTVFSKKISIFWENCEKMFWGHIWRFFRERRRLAPKINITFYHKWGTEYFYYLLGFSKKAVFSEKIAKTVSEGQVFFQGNRCLAKKMNIPFLWEKWFWIFFHVTIFSNKATFLKKIGKKHFCGTWPFFRQWGHLTLKMNITFFIKN